MEEKVERLRAQSERLPRREQDLHSIQCVCAGRYDRGNVIGKWTAGDLMYYATF